MPDNLRVTEKQQPYEVEHFLNDQSDGRLRRPRMTFRSLSGVYV